MICSRPSLGLAGPALIGFRRRHTRPSPAPKRKFVSGKCPQASVFSGPGSGRRVALRRQEHEKTPARSYIFTLLPPASCSTEHPFAIRTDRKPTYTVPIVPGLPKRMPKKIRNVRPVRCQGGGTQGSRGAGERGSMRAGGRPGADQRRPREAPFYAALTNRLLLLYCKRRGLDAWSSPAWVGQCLPRGGGKVDRCCGCRPSSRRAAGGSCRLRYLVHGMGALALVEGRKTMMGEQRLPSP